MKMTFLARVKNYGNLQGLLLLFGLIRIITTDITPIINLNPENTKIECIVSNMVKNLVLKEFHPTMFVVNNEMDNGPTNYTVVDTAISEAVKNQIPIVVLKTRISEINMLAGNYSGTMLSLIYFENCEVLRNIAKDMDKRIKYLIIIRKACESIINEILNELQFYEVKVFISDEDDETFTSLTIISEINEKSCRYDGRIIKEKLDLCCNHSNQNEESIKPSSLQHHLDLKKCGLNVGIATLYPYSMIKNKTNLKTFDPLQIDDINGSDLEIIKIIGNYFNATLNLHYIKRNEENPYFDSEYLKFIINGSLDVCVGGLYKIYGDVVSYSGIYSSQTVVWVYTVERSTKSWQMLLEKTHGLYIFLIFYIIYSITWKIVCKFDGKSVSITDTLFYSWGALVGTTSLQDARTMKQRILNILYLIMSLYLSSYVSCQIYSYLTIEEPPPHYKTVDELQTSGKTPYLVPISKYFVQDKKFEALANTSRDCVHFDDCEVKLLKYNASTILIDGYLPLLQARTAVEDEARVLKVTNEILTIYHEMLIRKDSPFVNGYRMATQRLFESGICVKLFDASIGITVVDRSKIAIKNILSNSYSCTVGCKITLLQLAGIFYLWIFGCTVSIFIFIMEITIERENGHRNNIFIRQ